MLANALASSLSPAGPFPCHSLLLQPLQSHFFECGHAKVEHTVQLAAANYLTCREVNSSCLSYSVITLLFIQGKPTLHHTKAHFKLNHHSGPEILARVASCQDIIFLQVSPALLIPQLSIISTLLLTEFTSGSKPL